MNTLLKTLKMTSAPSSVTTATTASGSNNNNNNNDGEPTSVDSLAESIANSIRLDQDESGSSRFHFNGNISSMPNVGANNLNYTNGSSLDSVVSAPDSPQSPSKHNNNNSNIANNTNNNNANNNNNNSQDKKPIPVKPIPALIYRKLVTIKLKSECLKLDDFEPKAMLGSGTFGRVRLVRLKSEPSTSKGYFAMKIMKKADIIRLKQVEHILSEVRLLGELSHPFIVNLSASFQDDARLYMIMEYVPGGELFSYLRRERRLKEDTARFYASEIVLAYEYLHGKNIAYRDLKPENLLITRLGSLKIADFGFAKLLDKGRTWTICGTPEYLAPEIVTSKGHGISVDWWALGILIFEMLAGYPPFYDEVTLVIYERIRAGRVEYPSFFDSKAKSLISKLLVADLSKRLGCLKDGAGGVMRHRWFAKVDWQSTLDRLVPAPYFPPLKDAGDSSNFDSFNEGDDSKGGGGGNGGGGEPAPISAENDLKFVSFGPRIPSATPAVMKAVVGGGNLTPANNTHASNNKTATTTTTATTGDNIITATALNNTTANGNGSGKKS
jgi:protein kinase X